MKKGFFILKKECIIPETDWFSFFPKFIKKLDPFMFLFMAGTSVYDKRNTGIKYVLLTALLLMLNRPSFSQEPQSLKSDRNLSGAVTLTNNGI